MQVMLDDELFLMLHIMFDDTDHLKDYREMEEFVLDRISEDLCRAYESSPPIRHVTQAIVDRLRLRIDIENVLQDALL